MFTIAATNNFSKWAKAILLAKIKTSNVVNFLKNYIIYRFGIPRQIIHDNGPYFISHAFSQFYNKYKIKDVPSTAYNRSTNGLAEAFDKAIIKLLKKFVLSTKRGWSQSPGECL